MREIDQLATTHLICKTTHESKFGDKDFHLFTCNDREAEEIEGRIPIEILSSLRESIKRFGEDTQALLDYVYFETEPMEGVKKGDLLDFSKARPMERISRTTLKKLSKKEIEMGKIHIARLVEKMKKSQKNLSRDSLVVSELREEVYLQALEFMDGDDLQTGLDGTARIIVE